MVVLVQVLCELLAGKESTLKTFRQLIREKGSHFGQWLELQENTKNT